MNPRFQLNPQRQNGKTRKLQHRWRQRTQTLSYTTLQPPHNAPSITRYQTSNASHNEKQPSRLLNKEHQVRVSKYSFKLCRISRSNANNVRGHRGPARAARLGVFYNARRSQVAANAELPANKSGIGGALAAQAPSGQNRLTGVPRAVRRHRDRHITHVLQPVLDGRCLRTAAILKEAERDSLAYLDSRRRTRSACTPTTTRGGQTAR